MAVRHVRVGDVLSANRTWITVEASAEYVPIGVRAFGRGIFHYEPVRGTGLGRLRFYEVKPSSLIVSNIKAWEGAIAISGSHDTGTIASNRFLSYTPVHNAADVDFLRHYFLTDAGNEQLQRASPGSADRNRTLAASRFEDIVVPLPTLAEQQRIAARLADVAATSRDPSEIKVFEPAWRVLVERLTFGRRGPRQELADSLRPKHALTVEPESDYRVAGVYSFGRGLLSRGRIRGSETKYKSFTPLAEDDVVYSKLGAFEGAAAVVPASFTGFSVSPEFPVFEVTGGIDPSFLRYCMIAESFVSQLIAASSGVGARQKRVSPGAFLKSTIPSPLLSEQRAVVRQLDLATHVLELKRDGLKIRRALLPAARNEAFANLT